MKTCTNCLQALPEKEVSYRQAAPREEAMTVHAPVPLKQKYPKVAKGLVGTYTFLSRLLVGLIALSMILGVIFAATIGAYWLGMFVANDIFGWQIGNIHRSPAGWAIGIVILAGPLLSYYLGKSILVNKEES
jgi:hypothetical protein